MIFDLGHENIAEWVDPDAVRRISEALARCAPEGLAGRYNDANVRRTATPAQMVDLQRFFRISAERNLGLIGWS